MWQQQQQQQHRWQQSVIISCGTTWSYVGYCVPEEHHIWLSYKVSAVEKQTDVFNFQQCFSKKLRCLILNLFKNNFVHTEHFNKCYELLKIFNSEKVSKFHLISTQPSLNICYYYSTLAPSETNFCLVKYGQKTPASHHGDDSASIMKLFGKEIWWKARIQEEKLFSRFTNSTSAWNIHLIRIPEVCGTTKVESLSPGRQDIWDEWNWNVAQRKPERNTVVSTVVCTAPHIDTAGAKTDSVTISDGLNGIRKHGTKMLMETTSLIDWQLLILGRNSSFRKSR